MAVAVSAVSLFHLALVAILLTVTLFFMACMADAKPLINILKKNFRGTTILVNGESEGNIVTNFPHLKKFYQLSGPVVDTERTMKVYHGIMQ